MERLTRRELWWGSQGKTEKAVNYKVDEERRCVTHDGSADFLIADRLSEYEDLEEQGKLLKLPCAVGDTVYCIYSRYTKCSVHNQEFEESSCLGCESECDSKKEYYVQEQRAYSLDWIVAQIVGKHFGKLVFLTKTAAEQALKEMEG